MKNLFLVFCSYILIDLWTLACTLTENFRTFLQDSCSFLPVCPGCLVFSLFGSIQEEVVKDAESVRNQQQQHLQQHSCTLDECFQLYTKEEQVSSIHQGATEPFSRLAKMI